MAAAVSAIWLLGFLASKAYDVMFGLTGDFAGGAPIAWLELGFHTLPLPVYCMLVSLIALLTLRFAVRVVVRIIPGATTWVGATTERLEALSVKAGLGDGVTLGSALLVGQMGVIALTYWYFQDFINAFTTPVIESTRALCAQLASPNENVRLLYFCVTSVLALAGGAAWTLLMRRNVQGAGATSAIALAGLALTALCTGMFAIPWPIVYRSTFRTARFGDERCYIVADRGQQLQLLCASPARLHNQIVDAGDSRLRREADQASLFDDLSRSPLLEAR